MRSHPVVWLLRLSWLALPFTLGDAIGATVADRSSAVQLVVTVGAWAVWATVLVASLVPHPVSLTAVRVLTPVAPVATLITLAGWGPDDATTATQVLGGVGTALACVAAGAALSGAVADEFVDAASYGDERRFALRVPMSFVVGPIPVFWLLLTGGCLGGPVLLAARHWVAGAVLCAVGLATLVPATKAFHGLSRRWIVFVPAGTTLVDHLALVDPSLFPARQITAVAAALEGTEAVDLTQGATGLVLEISLDAPVEVTVRTSGDGGELRLVRGVLVSPVRPGAVVGEATRRGLTPPPPPPFSGHEPTSSVTS